MGGTPVPVRSGRRGKIGTGGSGRVRYGTKPRPVDLRQFQTEKWDTNRQSYHFVKSLSPPDSAQLFFRMKSPQCPQNRNFNQTFSATAGMTVNHRSNHRVSLISVAVAFCIHIKPQATLPLIELPE